MQDREPLSVTLNQAEGSGWHVLYAAGIAVDVGRLTNYSRSPKAEVTITATGVQRPLYRGDLGLLSRTGVKDCVTLCKRRRPAPPNGEGKPSWEWEDLIDDALQHALDGQRKTVQPKVIGVDRPALDRPPYKLWPLIPSKQPAIAFGAGGVGKSWLGVLCCALVDNGLSVAGLRADPGRALYVDFESSEDVLHERAWAIKNGLPEVPDAWGLNYLAGVRPLTEWADDLARKVESGGHDLVVIDSVGLSMSSDAVDSKDVIGYFQALMQIDAALLLIDHTSKTTEGDKTAFGSTYKTTSARSVWEMRGANAHEGGNILSFGMFHRKTNGELFKPFGMDMTLDKDNGGRILAATFTNADLNVHGDIEQGLTVPQRLTALLSRGQLSREDIHAKLADQTTAYVDSQLSRMTQRGLLVKPARGTYGLANLP